jgi:AraC family transcriptional regulator
MPRIYVKNMVCDRCKKVVGEELLHLNLSVKVEKLGEVWIDQPLNAELMQKIRLVLEKNGFELLDDKRSQLIEKIKTLIIKLIHSSQEPLASPLSEILQQELGKDYSYLSALFSETEGLTIEKFFILQRLERAKEWLVYGELSTKEIAYQLGFSSVAHLSAQFKKETGLTPGEFRAIGHDRRATLDKVGTSPQK